jgi:hypothetical protein
VKVVAALAMLVVGVLAVSCAAPTIPATARIQGTYISVTCDVPAKVAKDNAGKRLIAEVENRAGGVFRSWKLLPSNPHGYDFLFPEIPVTDTWAVDFKWRCYIE